MLVLTFQAVASPFAASFCCCTALHPTPASHASCSEKLLVDSSRSLTREEHTDSPPLACLRAAAMVWGGGTCGLLI